MRWAMLLQSYNFDIQHRPGKANGCADALSRRSYELNTKEEAFNGEELFPIAINSKEEMTDIERSQKSDSFISSRIQYLTNKVLPNDKKEAWEILVDIEGIYSEGIYT